MKLGSLSFFRMIELNEITRLRFDGPIYKVANERFRDVCSRLRLIGKITDQDYEFLKYANRTVRAPKPRGPPPPRAPAKTLST
jgi:hypothetical protein